MWVWAGQEAAGLQAQKQLSGGPLVNGVPLQRAPLFQVAGDLVRRLHLEAHVDKPVATYSGGTKRKLSTALALLGKPDRFGLRPQGPCRVGTGESGLDLSEEGSGVATAARNAHFLC